MHSVCGLPALPFGVAEAMNTAPASSGRLLCPLLRSSRNLRINKPAAFLCFAGSSTCRAHFISRSPDILWQTTTGGRGMAPIRWPKSCTASESDSPEPAAASEVPWERRLTAYVSMPCSWNQGSHLVYALQTAPAAIAG